MSSQLSLKGFRVLLKLFETKPQASVLIVPGAMLALPRAVTQSDEATG